MRVAVSALCSDEEPHRYTHAELWPEESPEGSRPTRIPGRA